MTKSASTKPADMLPLLRQHLAWYPLMQVRDAYKLIYQGATGSEHMVGTEQEFRRRLENEYFSLQPGLQERLLEAVRADQSLFRLNLRAYKAANHPLDRLAALLLETPRLFQGSMGVLMADWNIFNRLCESGELSSFEHKEVRRFNLWLQQQDYPAVHHSQVYRREYQPAYRLIAAQLVSALGVIHAGRI